MKGRWFGKLLLRRALVILSLLLQIWLFADTILEITQFSPVISALHSLLSLAVVIHVIARKDKGAFKTSWLVLLLVMPVFGGVLYVLFSQQASSRLLRRRQMVLQEQAAPMYALPGSALEQLCAEAPRHGPQARYLEHCAGFPVFSGTRTRYLSPGETMLQALLPQLEKAEKYIFIETFILQEGAMWDSILPILERKAAAGVEVRVIYDDVGCFLTLPQNYARVLEEKGIHCAVFNPFKPFLTAQQNNRDHRKICVIDGRAAITGGINLADEYINAVEKYGHWKDAAVLLEGPGAWSFAVLFLQMWQLCTGQELQLEAYIPQFAPQEEDGFVQPYGDSPLDEENVGEHVYLQTIQTARDYLYINTPYLIIDDSMTSALCLAAKSGVDVRIVTPHRWDKWAVHMTTRSYYRELIRAGVKVYEYSGGFIHSKTFVSDDTVAVIGTTNLDFRSLYLHYECGTLLYGSRAVQELKEDFLQTLQRCQPVTREDCRVGLLMRIFQDVMRLFAPLL